MKITEKSEPQLKKPAWLKRRLPAGSNYEHIRSVLRHGKLHTVCQEAQCPNIWECFSQHTATFLIMGPRCTRACRFCAVEQGPMAPPDPREPARVAEAAYQMKLKYVVVTSVTRDDLADGGAGCFATTIQAIKKRLPNALIEVLIPDFQGKTEAVQTVVRARPDVINHNIETVKRLYASVRPQAEYTRSLQLLEHVYQLDAGIPTKSGLMLGLGETADEISATLLDLRKAHCRFLTLGQYLQPSKHHLPVNRYLPPKEFDQWRQKALELGFTEVASGPFVRSSYHAGDLFKAAFLDEQAVPECDSQV